MNLEKFSMAMGQLEDRYLEEALHYRAGKRCSWLRWGALAACLALVLAAGAPLLWDFIGPRGGPGQEDPLRPRDTIEFNGAYYRVVDMEDTGLLDDYALPHAITGEMVGEELGWGLDPEGNPTREILYQYLPGSGDSREGALSQRAVYVASVEGQYTFALFCSFLHFDTNTYQEAGEMFRVYGVEDAGDLRSARIDGVGLSPWELRELYEAILEGTAMGHDDYQEAVFRGLTREERRELRRRLEDSVVELRLVTSHGLVINDLRWFPTTGFLSWGQNYYRLSLSLLPEEAQGQPEEPQN